MTKRENRWVCGHKKRMVVIDACPSGMSKYLRWTELPEPKRCYKCWVKDQKQDKKFKALSLSEKEKSEEEKVLEEKLELWDKADKIRKESVVVSRLSLAKKGSVRKKMEVGE